MGLLTAALHGLSKFAHLVNIDFFKDLLAVLKGIIMKAGAEGPDEEDGKVESLVDTDDRLRLQLHCTVTAYELLTGQGKEGILLRQ
jgi:nucleolar complex protein 3